MNQSFLENLLQRQVQIGEALTVLQREQSYTHRAIEELLQLERLGNSRDEVVAASERVASRGHPLEVLMPSLPLPEPLASAADAFTHTAERAVSQHVGEPTRIPDLGASRERLLQSVDRVQNIAQQAAAARRAAPVEDGPTEVTPASQRAAAAPMPASPPVDRRKEQVDLLVGRKSLFCHYFSPNTFAGGRGFLQTGHAGLKQYQQDVFNVPMLKLMAWPDGFYFNEKTGARQLMVKIGIGVVVVNDTDKPDSAPVLLPSSPELAGKLFPLESMHEDVLEQVTTQLRTRLEQLTAEALGQ